MAKESIFLKSMAIFTNGITLLIMDDNCIRNILLNNEDIQSCCKLLLEITFNSADWNWVQDICIDIINSDKEKNLCGLAVTCLGHLARIHGVIDKNKVLAVLNANRWNDNISDRIDDAISDIDMFTT